MYWLTENPVPLIMIGILFIGASIGFGILLKVKRLFWVAGLSLLLTVLVVLVDHYVVTDNENVRGQVYQMARCVRQNNVSGLMEYASAREGKSGARRRIEAEMPDYLFRGCRIGALEVEFDPSSKTATAYFTAFVDVDATKRYGHDGIGSRKVVLKFEKEEDGVWRVVHFDHHHTMKGIR